MRWGIDLGGSKIEGVVLDEGNRPLFRDRIETESVQGYTHIVHRVAEMVRIMQKATGQRLPEAIGIGTPGTVDPPTGLMKNCNTVCLNGQALPDDLADAIGTRIVIANDANCFALAEATIGAARGYPTVFGVIMGSGVGGGLVVQGQVLNGAHGIAGEWGHNVLEPDGRACYCGKTGCVETVLSGKSLERWYFERTGVERKLDDILARRAEDPDAEATYARLIERFGEALSVVVDIFDPHAIVLGGGVGNVAGLYTDGRESLSRWVFNPRFETPLLRPMHGDSAGVLGAAFLV